MADAEQYELMPRAYAAVGEDFTGKDDLIGAKYSKLLRLEMVPERAVLTHETKKLYDDSTVHLLYSNYCIQPIYQELLHSSSRPNATRECERKRPSSGLARVTVYAKPPKLRRPSASGTSFRDWIGGTCQADTLQVPTGPQWCCNSCRRRRIPSRAPVVDG